MKQFYLIVFAALCSFPGFGSEIPQMDTPPLPRAEKAGPSPLVEGEQKQTAAVAEAKKVLNARVREALRAWRANPVEANASELRKVVEERVDHTEKVRREIWERTREKRIDAEFHRLTSPQRKSNSNIKRRGKSMDFFLCFTPEERTALASIREKVKHLAPASKEARAQLDEQLAIYRAAAIRMEEARKKAAAPETKGMELDRMAEQLKLSIEAMEKDPVQYLARMNAPRHSRKPKTPPQNALAPAQE